MMRQHSSFALEDRLGDNSKSESTESKESRTEDATTRSDGASKLLDEDVLSVYGEALSGGVGFGGRSSWEGEPVDNSQDDPLLGTTLHDTYFVSRIIGEGGMGRVYEARHTRIASKRFALKVLHAEFARNPDIRRRFQHEVEAAAKIEHPGIVGTYDVGETPGSGPYMVCEYLAGEDLNDYLTARGALSARAVVHIGKQLCGALGAAHSRGVIHRDLKPHNVFVVAEEGSPSRESKLEDDRLPSVKVLDFGLSRFVERDNDLTKTGIILGTPGYMAPEQAGGLDTDHRTDIYGIGSLLYATATGRAPFKEDSPQLTVLSVLRQAPPRPRDLVNTIPIELEIVIQRAMARDPNERYQNVESMGQALAKLDTSRDFFGNAGQLRAGLRSPRLQLLLSLLTLFVLGVPALSLALFSAFQILGTDLMNFRPSALEWLLFGLLSIVLLFPLGLVFRFFRDRIWNDSARVAELAPKVRRSLFVATLAYGFSALVLLSARGLRSFLAHRLGETPESELLSWFVLLPLNAALAASMVIFWEASRKFKTPLVRALSGVGYSAGAGVAGLVLLVSLAVAPSSLTVAVSQESSRETLARPEVAAAVAIGGMENSHQPQVASRAPDVVSGVAVKPSVEAPVIEKSQPSEGDVSRKRAPAQDLALAQGRGSAALENLLEKYPNDGRILRALVLVHASRADTLELSVKAISRLFEVEPEFTNDAEVLFILKKGLLANGAPHQIGFEIVRDQMGEDGGELVYQLLSEHPKQQSRLKNIFFELRKANRVSSSTSIAYDLRYASSCQGRLSLLERAETDGDIRSLHQLQALSTTPKSCGWGWRTCKPLCPVEAKRFRESVELIQTRLDGR